MENASKALIMAGSILMAILVIGLLVFGYQQLSSLQQTETDAEDNDKLARYMNQFEQFGRTLYGSELLSLANFTNPSISLTEILTFSIFSSRAVPGLPGATKTLSARGEREARQARACSRPPLPITKTFI